MFSGCMLAKKESEGGKKKLLLGSLSVASLFILAGVYMYAHVWLHHPNSGKAIGPVIRRHACKPLLFSVS